MWKEKLQDLRNAGLKWRQIGDYCGVGRSSIHDLWSGRSKVPSAETGLKLKKLHYRTMRKVAAAAAMTPPRQG